jgi:hypothetical protein
VAGASARTSGEGAVLNSSPQNEDRLDNPLFLTTLGEFGLSDGSNNDSPLEMLTGVGVPGGVPTWYFRVLALRLVHPHSEF